MRGASPFDNYLSALSECTVVTTRAASITLLHRRGAEMYIIYHVDLAVYLNGCHQAEKEKKNHLKYQFSASKAGTIEVHPQQIE